MSPVLSVKNLTKVYSGKKPHLAVDGISFQLGEGEILGLLGPNGSGKTTTIQMLLGTLAHTSGEIEYFGRNFFKYRSEVLQDVAFASTYTNLPWILTIEENLYWVGSLYGLSRAESRARFKPLLERFGLGDLLKRRASSLSAGQSTRLMLVKAFFVQPKILLLDEPTASLDPDVAQEICQFLMDERQRSGLSILFCSHKMDEVTEVCDRVVVLKKGKILADDLPENLAKSVSAFQLRLVIPDGMKRTIALVEARKLPYQVEHRSITITIEDAVIPLFLRALSQADIAYTGIRIEEPSLEEYFLNISRGQK
jgi:ABC-2 type transport system ATP-binding protein